MIDHCNRWLLGFAAAYLALLPTNTATFAHSLAYGGAIVFALCAFGLTERYEATRVPRPGWSIGITLLAWSAWSLASLAWSIDPGYSETQLEREVGDSLVVMFVFYVAARDARSFRVLAAAALAGLAVLAAVAIGTQLFTGDWDAGRWHYGVGPWSTWTVLVAPLLFALIAPRPAGFGTRRRSVVIGLVIVAMMVVTDRMTDNRIVWVALAGVFGVASLAAALRWPQTLVRTPLRWIGPFAALLIVLGIAFADALHERAAAESPRASVTDSIESDPRIVLWERVRDKIEARPWTGYGFGRRVLAGELSKELGDPLLAHAHNIFASQWLQTGLIGMTAFTALLLALIVRFARFLRSRDDTLAFVGMVGLALIAGFVIKNLTDDFLFRSNAKEFWALSAMLLGYGVRRARTFAAGETPTPASTVVQEPVETPRTTAAKANAELVDH